MPQYPCDVCAEGADERIIGSTHDGVGHIHHALGKRVLFLSVSTVMASAVYQVLPLRMIDESAISSHGNSLLRRFHLGHDVRLDEAGIDIGRSGSARC